MEDKILRIGNILNLSSTTSRESAVKSLIENTLYSYNEELDIEELINLIEDIFNIKPFKKEIQDVIKKAKEEGEVNLVANKYKLSQDRYFEIQKNDKKKQEEELIRYKRFENICNGLLNLKNEQIQRLWNSFNEYIYECFYLYGENAVNHFRAPRPESEFDNLMSATAFQDVIEKIGSEELKITFKNIITIFIKNIGSEDIEYLESLAKKTIAFHSLGLPADLHAEVINLNVINWTIFVDTNFLFSILNLHIHPENDASNQLLALVKNTKLNIKFSYIPFTMSELKGRKSDFDDYIPKVNLEQSLVSGLIKSEKLDGFSQAYYENLSEKSESTLHPSDVIDLAERTFKYVKGIQLYNSKFENIPDDYIKSKVEEYRKYIDLLNGIYYEKEVDRNIFRSYKQLYHDVLLREAIEYLQRKSTDGEPKTLSEVKFLGVTLDKILIKYDRYDLGKTKKEFIIPHFYLPSFLLNKLYSLVPVQTGDYKKAFVTAIATFSFFESREKSKEVQRFVSYYRNQGLVDENLLLSFITDEFFLNKFFNEETEKDSFFESEMNKKFVEMQNKYEEAEKKKDELLGVYNKNLEDKNVQDKRILYQNEVINELQEQQRVLFSGLKKLQEKRNKEDHTRQIDIISVIEEKQNSNEIKSLREEREKLQEEKDQLLLEKKRTENIRREERRSIFIKNELRAWRKPYWITLFLIVFVLLLILVSLLYICDWNINNLTQYVKILHENNIIISIIFNIFLLLLNIWVLKSLYDKYLNHSNIKAYKEQIPIPDDLKHIT